MDRVSTEFFTLVWQEVFRSQRTNSMAPLHFASAPNTKSLVFVPEKCKEGLLDKPLDRLEMRTKNLRKDRSSAQVKEPPAYGILVSKKALLTCIAIDINDKGHPPSKSFTAEVKKINDQDKRDKQGSANKYGGEVGE